MKEQSSVEIEKGIPFPSRSKNKGVSEALRKMKPGDSIWISGSRSNALQIARRNGIKITTSAETKSGKQGYRLWRMK